MAKPPVASGDEGERRFSAPVSMYTAKPRSKTPQARTGTKGDVRGWWDKGVEVQMAANALSFLVGVVLPLGGAVWLLLH
jgi:hypothetical protein